MATLREPTSANNETASPSANVETAASPADRSANETATTSTTAATAHDVQDVDLEVKLEPVTNMSSPSTLKDMTPELESITRYFHNMEQRIKSLEAQVEKLTGTTIQHGESASSVSGFPRSNISASAKPQILKLNRQDFEKPDSGLEPLHAIELLVDNDTIMKIRIRSERLLKLFQELMAPEVAPDPSWSVVMARPFKALMMYSDRFADFLSQQGTESHDSTDEQQPAELPALEQEPQEGGVSIELIGSESVSLGTLIKTLQDGLFDDYAAYAGLRNRTRKPISFLQLWYLFQPGDVVIGGSGTSIQAYRIRSVHGSTLQNHQSAVESTLNVINSPFELECFSLGYNGKVFGPIRTVFTIMPFVGWLQITSLPTVPIEYLRENEIQEQLISRGKLFNLLRKPSHKSYSGLSLDEIAEEVEGDIMVDFELYYRQNPDKAPRIDLHWFTEESNKEVINDGTYDDSKIDKYLTEIFLKSSFDLLQASRPNNMEDPDILVDNQLMLLPNLIWAFNLRNRKWHPLDVSLVCEIVYPKNAFDYLVLPAHHKLILSTLVSQYGTSNPIGNRPKFNTVISKGKGLVILLHGPPGVGKTSTAECLAVNARKPLLPITAADIGITANEVERNLDTLFTLSQRWRCVLLFDEAEIVLQARTREDMQRNSIVSVFLRALEYYSGILIFTTNRVGTIDEAFSSRIHVSLYFPSLNRDSFMKIWEINLRRVMEEERMESAPIEIRFASIMDFLDRYWDQQDHMSPPSGRFIRNAVQSAMALAEFDQGRESDGNDPPRLTRHHIEAVLKSSNDFMEYMMSVHGATDSERARLSEFRNDEFIPEMSQPKRRAASKPLYTTSRQSEKLSKFEDTSGIDSD